MPLDNDNLIRRDQMPRALGFSKNIKMRHATPIVSQRQVRVYLTHNTQHLLYVEQIITAYFPAAKRVSAPLAAISILLVGLNCYRTTDDLQLQADLAQKFDGLRMPLFMFGLSSSFSKRGLITTSQRVLVTRYSRKDEMVIRKWLDGGTFDNAAVEVEQFAQSCGHAIKQFDIKVLDNLPSALINSVHTVGSEEGSTLQDIDASCRAQMKGKHPRVVTVMTDKTRTLPMVRISMDKNIKRTHVEFTNYTIINKSALLLQSDEVVSNASTNALVLGGLVVNADDVQDVQNLLSLKYVIAKSPISEQRDIVTRLVFFFMSTTETKYSELSFSFRRENQDIPRVSEESRIEMESDKKPPSQNPFKGKGRGKFRGKRSGRQ